jgi:uncharacterized damage-inducible protein DinB
MDSTIEAMINELSQEAATTKRILERVPEGQLSWRPHAKSMTLGQLALHVASTPGNLSGLAQLEEFDALNANFEPPVPTNKEQIMSAFEASVSGASSYLRTLTTEAAGANWRLTLRGKEVFSMPRVGLLRSLMLNHWYHHRGQLSVYLRLLDVPVPVVYGRSADENPFA